MRMGVCVLCVRVCVCAWMHVLCVHACIIYHVYVMCATVRVFIYT